MKSFNDTEMADLEMQRRIAPRAHRSALPPRQHQLAMAAHATMMSMIQAGFVYDVATRAWIKRASPGT